MPSGFSREEGLALNAGRVMGSRFLALLVLFGCAIFFLGARDFGGGVDGGVHYAIADQLSENLAWPFSKDSFLSWIPHYPPGAHFLAATIGAVVGSTLHALFIVTAISVVVFYLVAADLMRGASLLKTISHYAVFVILAIAFRKYRFLTGNEMIDNFFFAQLAGNAALMAGFCIIYRTANLAFGRWLAIGFVTTHVVGWFFPLSAIELALAAAVVRGAPMLALQTDTKKRIIEIAISAVILAAAAVIHPTIIDMIVISANDGATSISDSTIIVLVLGVSILMPVFLITFLGSGSVRAGAIFALGAGALAPCLLLGILLFMGTGGSLYAVKKSGFLLGTVACIMLSVLIVEFIDRIAQRRFSRYTNVLDTLRFSPLQTVISCVFVAAVIFSVFSGRLSEPVGRLKSYDDDVRQLLSQGPPDGFYGATLSMNSALTPHINFLIGYPLLRQTAATAVQHKLFASKYPDLTNIKSVIVNVDEGSRYKPDCVIRSSERLKAISSDCILSKPP